MQIEKLVEVSDLVKIEVDAEDMIKALIDHPDTERLFLRILNDIGAFFREVPDTMIDNLTDSQRKSINSFLEDQSKRYAL